MIFFHGSDSKESPCNAGDLGSSPELERSPGEWNGPTLVFLSGEFHGQRSLVAYSLWGCKESDMTEWLTHSLFHFHENINTLSHLSFHCYRICSHGTCKPLGTYSMELFSCLSLPEDIALLFSNEMLKKEKKLKAK